MLSRKAPWSHTLCFLVRSRASKAATSGVTSRARAEWPLVEASVRLKVDAGKINFARVAIGGVAPRPMRLPKVEAALVGGGVDEPTLMKACEHAKAGANPLPMTGYKVDLLAPTIVEALTLALATTPASPPPRPKVDPTASKLPENSP